MRDGFFIFFSERESDGSNLPGVAEGSELPLDKKKEEEEEEKKMKKEKATFNAAVAFL